MVKRAKIGFMVKKKLTERYFKNDDKGINAEEYFKKES